MTPDIGSKMHFRLCCSVKHIDEALATNCNPERHPELRRRAIKNLRSERAKFARAKKRAGIPQAGERADLADEHEKSLLRSLALTIPSTVESTQAVLKYWWLYQDTYRDDLTDEMKDTMRLLMSIYQAVGFIGRVQS
jgi:hypothetical protein